MRFVGSRLPRLGALVLLCAFALAGSASAATAPIQWGSATPYQPSSTEFELFFSISCPSTGECVAVGEAQGSGSGSYSGPVVAVEQNGVWGAPVDLTGLPSGPVLSSVACSSASSCYAVSDGGVVVPLSISGTTAAAGAPQTVGLPGGETTGTVTLDGISCAGSCTAVGEYTPTSGTNEAVTSVPGGGGTWTSTAVTAPAAATGGADLTAISCPDSGPCEAVGYYLDGSNHLYSWAVQVTAGAAGVAEPVAMPSDFLPSAYQSGILPALAADGLMEISCPSAGVCTAAGNYIDSSGNVSPVAVPITSGAPRTAVELATPSFTPGTTPTPGDYLAGISCSDASDCVVAGTQLDLSGAPPDIEGQTAYETDGSWTALTTLPTTGLGGEAPLVSALACSAADQCALTGVGLPLGGGTPTAFFAASVPSVAVVTSALPAATVGVPYSATLNASGGIGSYSWSVGPGSLPAGLSLNPATGVISGTPTASGQSGFIVTASSAGELLSASAGLSITVNPEATTAVSPPKPTPSVAIAYLSTSGHKLVLVLRCSGAACKGNLKLTGVEHLQGKTVTAVAASGRHRIRKITLARGSYSLQAGYTEVRTLKLSKSTARLLGKLHRIHGELTLTPTGAKKAAIIRKLTFKA
jgi:hypothetical protein